VKRATPDSNILVSAIVFGGKPGELLDMANRGEIDLVVSPEIAGGRPFYWSFSAFSPHNFDNS